MKSLGLQLKNLGLGLDKNVVVLVSVLISKKNESLGLMKRVLVKKIFFTSLI